MGQDPGDKPTGHPVQTPAQQMINRLEALYQAVQEARIGPPLRPAQPAKN